MISKQNYILQIINGKVKKVENRGDSATLHIFDYKDHKEANKIIEDQAAIYIINIGKGTNEYYVGQTSRGVSRLYEHRMKKYIETSEIYYFTFNKSPNKNELDAIEFKLIDILKNIGYVTTHNKTSGNSSFITDGDEQYVLRKLQEINILLEVVNLKLSDSESTTEFKMDIEKMKDDAIRANNSFEVKEMFNEKFLVNETNPKTKAIIEFVKGNDDEYWVLKAGSKTNIHNYWKRYSEKPETSNYKFVFKNLINVDEDGMVLQDIKWSSPSALSAFAIGKATSNGWVEMKNADGKTPTELYRVLK